MAKYMTVFVDSMKGRDTSFVELFRLLFRMSCFMKGVLNCLLVLICNYEIQKTTFCANHNSACKSFVPIATR